AVSKVLQRIELYHGDYEHLLKLPGDEVFIFLDPPYYSATASKLYGRKVTYTSALTTKGLPV
ncbi:MAG: hypothetical protein NZ851_04625, partial [Aquificaceae bacterium]|nr:hypothetical protein [Aquificaceae bacterium]